MKYKFDNLIVENPTFTFSKGPTVGNFVTINVRINFGAYINWMIGAMPIDEDMEIWGKKELEIYKVID